MYAILQEERFVNIQMWSNLSQAVLYSIIRCPITISCKIENNHLALAGVFRILKGKIRSHVQPDYK